VSDRPLGAVLAGGRGSRLGGRKATAEVHGRPLLDWTLEALRASIDDVVVIAKVATPLPPCDAPIWRSEPPDFHPRHGLVSALRGARGRTVMVVPVDMPLVPAALVETLLAIVEDGAPAAIPAAGGRIHPLCACYHPSALGPLEDAPADEPLKRTLDRLGAVIIPADAMADRLLNVNTPADLKVAERLIASRSLMTGAWDAAADDWIAWARSPEADHFYWLMNRPRLLELLPPPGNLTIDIGCGEGRLARELTGLGHRVVGIESSPRLADAAREGEPPTQVLVADAAALPLDDGVADLAIACMSLLNIADLDRAVAEVARVLEPGGRFCFATVHPMRSFEEVEGETYFGERAFAETRERLGLSMTFHDMHRPLSALTSAFERAGLAIEALREPVPDADHVAAHPEVAKWRRRPAFLHGRLVKP
jgi:molybdopterin-guanine dinucleotide biosynthesis protein A/SAM-dependent methyltransferase